MSWLAIDDAFVRHPKVLQLGSVQARWAWLEVLSYCARYRTNGVIPEPVSEVSKGATPAFVKRAKAVGLIDVDDDGTMRVHDWKKYNGPNRANANRQARWRDRHNEQLTADVTDDAVTENVTSGVTDDVTENVTSALRKRDPRARRGAGAFPSPKELPPTGETDPDGSERPFRTPPPPSTPGGPGNGTGDPIIDQWRASRGLEPDTAAAAENDFSTLDPKGELP